MAGNRIAKSAVMARLIHAVLVLFACVCEAQAGNLTVLPVKMSKRPDALKSVAPEELRKVIEGLLPSDGLSEAPGALSSTPSGAKKESHTKSPRSGREPGAAPSNKDLSVDGKAPREPKPERVSPLKRTPNAKAPGKRSSTYGLQIKIETPDDGAAMVVGQILRNDGKVVRGPVSVRLDYEGEGDWRAQMKVALERVITALQPATLAPEHTPTLTPVVASKGSDLELTPPIGPIQNLIEPSRETPLPPPPGPPLVDVVQVAEKASPLKTTGIVLSLTGAVLLVSGSTLNIIGRIQARQVMNDDGLLKFGSGSAEAEQARAATTMQMAGATLGAVGLAAGVTGLIFWMKAPSEQTPQVAVTPTAGGFGLVVRGALP
jgi:hypothetical protein